MLLVSKFSIVSSLWISLALATQVYKWPDYQLQGLEENLYQFNAGPDFSQNNMQNFAGCAGRDDTTVTAQWVRIAYHDMAEHNKTSGTGGLDASIRFELQDPMNIGKGMNQSLGDFSTALTPFISMADMIALGTVIGVQGCGGPNIPFRYGRVDAQSAGTFDVPEPQQELQAHIASFDRQGFTQSEMIGLVACGHTLGGVRGIDFPQIIGSDGDSDFGTFDTTINFDANVVQEYLSGATTNPLVSGRNVTTRSDARIFGSDNNVTMKSISTPSTFASTCKTLLGRMIDTVPKDVKLKDPIQPINNKVDVITLQVQDGMFVFNTSLRTLIANPNEKVTLFWEGRTKNPCAKGGCSVPSSNPEPSSPFIKRLDSEVMSPSRYAIQAGITEMTGYFFSAKIPIDSGLGRFWFSVDNSAGKVTKVDNGGTGFVLDQDTVFQDPGRSFRYTVADGPITFRLVIAVRDAVAKAPDFRLTLKTYDYSVIPKNGVDPLIETVTPKPDDTNNPPNDGHHFFATNLEFGISSLFAIAEAGGKKFQTYVQREQYTAVFRIREIIAEPTPN